MFVAANKHADQTVQYFLVQLPTSDWMRCTFPPLYLVHNQRWHSERRAENTPKRGDARATVEAKLASPDDTVEIMVVASRP
jgi:hypothetical protein